MTPATTREPGEPGGRGWTIAGVAVALAFLAVGVATLDDRGLTWDEPESVYAGLGNLEILRAVVGGRGGGEVEWPWHELRGYQFAVDTARVAFARAVVVGGPELAGVPIRGLHLFHLLLATASLLLVHRIGADLSGSPRIGALSALVLAVSPKLVAHSQNNPKDLVGLFAYALFLWALERAVGASEASGRWRPGAFAAAGLALGFAFSSHVLSALLVPIGVVWVLLRLPVREERRWRDRLGSLSVLGAVSAATAFALWPWLWAEPLVRTARVVRRVARFEVEIDVLYLGRLYPWADPPFHYFAVSLLVATPVAITLAAGFGALAGLRRSAPGRLRRPVLLALLWAGVPMGVEALTGARYDGVRHLLVVLPAVALLAGVGLDRLLGLASARGTAAPGRRRWSARAAVAAACATLLWVLVDLARYHPYQDAYLNLPVRRTLALLDLPPEEVFELEYWGSTYKEGAEWLNAHAGAGAVVHLPIARWCAEPYLDPDLRAEGPRWLAEAPCEPGWASRTGTGAPHYLMVMTRRGLLSPALETLRREREPVHTVERLGATLLEIYRL